MNSQTLNSYNNYAPEYASSADLKGLNKFIEKPAMFDLLPDITGDRVICLGCGSGDECFEMIKRGAKSVLGLDASYGMIEQARKKYKHVEDISFIVGDFANIEQDYRKFDLVYSSLAFHYEKNFEELIRGIKKFFAKGSVLLFSMSHPIRSSYETETIEKNVVKGLAEITLANKETKFVGDYFKTEMIEETWMQGKFQYNYYHHKIEDVFNALSDHHFRILKVVEPKPVDEGTHQIDPKYFKYPPFLIVKCVKT
jgi:ubiquinone/menaquinone biosynthesis C-methylase UbiE